MKNGLQIVTSYTMDVSEIFQLHVKTRKFQNMSSWFDVVERINDTTCPCCIRKYMTRGDVALGRSSIKHWNEAAWYRQSDCPYCWIQDFALTSSRRRRYHSISSGTLTRVVKDKDDKDLEQIFWVQNSPAHERRHRSGVISVLVSYFPIACRHRWFSIFVRLVSTILTSFVVRAFLVSNAATFQLTQMTMSWSLISTSLTRTSVRHWSVGCRYTGWSYRDRV